MQWKTFFKIVLLILLVKFLFWPKVPQSNLSRYQYISKETAYVAQEFKNADNQPIIEDVPIVSWGIIDTWTGKVYLNYDVPKQLVSIIDLINANYSAMIIPKDSFQANTSLMNQMDFDEARRMLMSKLEREKNLKTLEILKATRP